MYDVVGHERLQPGVMLAKSVHATGRCARMP